MREESTGGITLPGIRRIQMEKNNIRFIDSRYNELFTVPDGGKIQIAYLDGGTVIRACKYLDDCHVRVGNTAFHIHEFARSAEQNGVVYAPDGKPRDRYEIYQIEDVGKVDYCFRSFTEAGSRFNPNDYRRVYAAALASNVTLDDIYARHNRDDRPFGRNMRSLSMSDVILLARGEHVSAFYVDTIGFKEVPHFLGHTLPFKDNRPKNKEYER